MDKSERVVVPVDVATKVTISPEAVALGFGTDIRAFIGEFVDRWLDNPQTIQTEFLEQDLHLKVHHEGITPAEILEAVPELRPPTADLFFEVQVTSEQLAILQQLTAFVGGVLTPGEVVGAALRNLAMDIRGKPI